MRTEKKKPLTKQQVEEFLFMLRDRADAQYRIIDSLRRQVDTVIDCAKHNEQDIRDRLTSLERANQSLESGFSKLIQQHCKHDFEIVGGCISNKNRISKSYWPVRNYPRTVAVKCVRCGYEKTISADELAGVESVEPKKLNWFKRFWNHCFPFTSPWRE